MSNISGENLYLINSDKKTNNLNPDGDLAALSILLKGSLLDGWQDSKMHLCFLAQAKVCTFQIIVDTEWIYLLFISNLFTVDNFR